MDDKSTNEGRESYVRKEVLVGGVCAASWHTWVRGQDDDVVEVKVDGTGKITGTHKKSGNPIYGQCTEGKPHIIHFYRTDTDGCKYTYDGTIGYVNFPIPGQPPTTPFFVIVGKVNISNCPSKDDGDDDWMGTHTT